VPKVFEPILQLQLVRTCKYVVVDARKKVYDLVGKPEDYALHDIIEFGDKDHLNVKKCVPDSISPDDIAIVVVHRDYIVLGNDQQHFYKSVGGQELDDIYASSHHGNLIVVGIPKVAADVAEVARQNGVKLAAHHLGELLLGAPDSQMIVDQNQNHCNGLVEDGQCVMNLPGRAGGYLKQVGLGFCDPCVEKLRDAQKDV